jgi:hypothetical protein
MAKEWFSMRKQTRQQFLPLELETRPTVDTATAAYCTARHKH